MMSGRTSRFPFTASQWQELELQALIFKYMVSGAPVPHELILPLRQSFFPDPPPPAQLFPHQSALGWSCFQMGLGRKTEDPEPGRCRRTDGKKWRCSKEAYPDSKYCERHMHRGKNRSRKPVEISVPTISTSVSAQNNSSLYPQPHLLHFASMDSSSQADNRNQRYFTGMVKRDEDHHQYGFLSEDSRGGGPWRFTPLGINSLGNGGSDFPKEEEKRQHCFVLGTDLKEEKAAEEQRLRRRFSDDWGGGFPTTQLSISIPMARRDFSVPRSHGDD